MIGIDLGIPSLALRASHPGIAALNPSLWLDPSDPKTLFQDAAGTVPVTAPGQPVGLMLDKSRGLSHGPNVVTNGSFTNGGANWKSNGESTFSNGEARILSSDGAYSNIVQSGALTVGKWYLIEYTVTAYTEGQLSISGAPGNPSLPVTPGRHSIIIQTTVDFLSIRRRSGTVDVSITDVSASELPGHHAIQATNSNLRPSFEEDASGRRYLQFDGADHELSSNALPFSPAATNVTAFRLNGFNDAAPHILANRDPGANNPQNRQPLLYLQTGFDRVYAGWGAGVSYVDIGQSPVGLDIVLSSWTDNLQKNLNANGEAKTDATTQAMADGGLGRFRISGGNRAFMRFYGTAQFNRRLSPPEINRVRQVFAAKSGGLA